MQLARMFDRSTGSRTSAIYGKTLTNIKHQKVQLRSHSFLNHFREGASQFLFCILILQLCGTLHGGPNRGNRQGKDFFWGEGNLKGMFGNPPLVKILSKTKKTKEKQRKTEEKPITTYFSLFFCSFLCMDPRCSCTRNPRNQKQGLFQDRQEGPNEQGPGRQCP